MVSREVAVRTPNKDRVFVGKAWLNKGRESGVEYTNLYFDRGFKVTITDVKNNVEYTIPEGGSMQGFPNSKREGKKDADLRFSFRVAPIA